MTTNLMTYAGSIGPRAQYVERNVREQLAKTPANSLIRESQVAKLVDVLDAVSRSANPDHAAFLIASHGEQGGLVARVASMCVGDPTMVLPAVLGAVNSSTDQNHYTRIEGAWLNARSTLQAQGLDVNHRDAGPATEIAGHLSQMNDIAKDAGAGVPQASLQKRLDALKPLSNAAIESLWTPAGAPQRASLEASFIAIAKAYPTLQTRGDVSAEERNVLESYSLENLQRLAVTPLPANKWTKVVSAEDAANLDRNAAIESICAQTVGARTRTFAVSALELPVIEAQSRGESPREAAQKLITTLGACLEPELGVMATFYRNLAA